MFRKLWSSYFGGERESSSSSSCKRKRALQDEDRGLAFDGNNDANAVDDVGQIPTIVSNDSGEIGGGKRQKLDTPEPTGLLYSDLSMTTYLNMMNNKEFTATFEEDCRQQKQQVDYNYCAANKGTPGLGDGSTAHLSSAAPPALPSSVVSPLMLPLSSAHPYQHVNYTTWSANNGISSSGDGSAANLWSMGAPIDYCEGNTNGSDIKDDIVIEEELIVPTTAREAKSLLGEYGDLGKFAIGYAQSGREEPAYFFVGWKNKADEIADKQDDLPVIRFDINSYPSRPTLSTRVGYLFRHQSPLENISYSEVSPYDAAYKVPPEGLKLYCIHQKDNPLPFNSRDALMKHADEQMSVGDLVAVTLNHDDDCTHHIVNSCDKNKCLNGLKLPAFHLKNPYNPEISTLINEAFRTGGRFTLKYVAETSKSAFSIYEKVDKLATYGGVSKVSKRWKATLNGITLGTFVYARAVFKHKATASSSPNDDIDEEDSTTRWFVDHTYHDFATYMKDGGKVQKHKKSESNFPARLFALLAEEKYSHIISWMVSCIIIYFVFVGGFVQLDRILTSSCFSSLVHQPHGRAFKIHNKKLLLEEALPKYTGQSKFSSFTRQLSGWGFKRLHQMGLGEQYLILCVQIKSICHQHIFNLFMCSIYRFWMLLSSLLPPRTSSSYDSHGEDNSWPG